MPQPNQQEMAFMTALHQQQQQNTYTPQMFQLFQQWLNNGQIASAGQQQGAWPSLPLQQPPPPSVSGAQQQYQPQYMVGTGFTGLVFVGS
jgi:hypothetical protein